MVRSLPAALLLMLPTCIACDTDTAPALLSTCTTVPATIIATWRSRYERNGRALRTVKLHVGARQQEQILYGAVQARKRRAAIKIHSSVQTRVNAKLTIAPSVIGDLRVIPLNHRVGQNRDLAVVLYQRQRRHRCGEIQVEILHAAKQFST